MAAVAHRQAGFHTMRWSGVPVFLVLFFIDYHQVFICIYPKPFTSNILLRAQSCGFSWNKIFSAALDCVPVAVTFHPTCFSISALVTLEAAGVVGFPS